eukprot:jgi/Hompol1/6942/HPOL_000974-RA
MITYLNDQDASLRSAFCETIVGVGTFVGMRSLEEYILPLMIQALTDSEEFVVEKVLSSLTSLAELGLIAKSKLKELCTTMIPLCCVVALLSSASRLLPPIDVRCVLYPMLKPFLRRDMPALSELTLIENLKTPVPRNLFEHTIQLASRTSSEVRLAAGVDSFVSDRSAYGQDHNDLLVRLKDLGMSDEDKEKLFAMKYFISKATAARLRKKSDRSSSRSDLQLGRIALRDYSVTLHTVFLTPPLNRSLQHSRNALRQSNPGMRESAESKRASRFSLIVSQVAESAMSLGSDERYSMGSSTDSDGMLVPRRAATRPKSETTLSNSKRHSKANSIGNYDLTVDPAELGANDKRVSGMSRMTASVESSAAADGQERYIRRVLEKKTKELFPPLLPELGPKISAAGRTAFVDARLRRTQTSGSTPSELRGWKPKGILVAHFTEHVAQINKIAVAPDHSFFASCSDDGTVKIWDTNRLHTNVANRARLTYSGVGAKVQTIAFCESRHSIVCAGDNGQIHIARVEHIRAPSNSVKYTGVSLVRTISLKNEFAVSIDHTESDTQSLLVYATTNGRLCALDLRLMKEVWSFQVPPHYGAITAFVMDPKRLWCLVGTHRGVLALWDVRFKLCTNVWMHPSKTRINKLSLYPCRSQSRAGANASGKLVAMAVGTATNEVSIWNIAT